MTQKIAKSLLLMGLVFTLVKCSHHLSNERTIASEKILDDNGLELSKEVIPTDEEASSNEIIKLIKTGYAHYKPKDLTPSAHRIIHGKQHGCVRAEFQVNDNLPKDYRYGIFSRPSTYPAWIRLSNGSGAPQHDGIPDARGLAIKLMDVKGEKLADEIYTQDFLLQSSPIFFVSDVASYIKFMKFTSNKSAAGVGELISSLKLNNSKDRNDLKLLVTESAATIKNPLTADYFSALPQSIGPRAMKLKARPCPNQKNSNLTTNFFSENFLGEIMSKELSENGACIELLVQLQTDAATMPIEDASIKWDDAKSPFVSVATINIPKQNFRSEKRMEFCENISFNPWHSILEHRPLGGLNRARKLIYEQSSESRHNLNNRTQDEPNISTLSSEE